MVIWESPSNEWAEMKSMSAAAAEEDHGGKRVRQRRKQQVEV